MKKKDVRLHEFSVIIRKRRLELGYSNAEMFANHHGLNRSVYQRWENGEDLNLSSLLKLLEILEMKGSEFFELLENRCELMPPCKYIMSIVADIKEEYNDNKKR